MAGLPMMGMGDQMPGRPPMMPGAMPSFPGASNPSAVAPFRPQGNFAAAGKLRLPQKKPMPGAPGAPPMPGMGQPGAAPAPMPGGSMMGAASQQLFQ